MKYLVVIFSILGWSACQASTQEQAVKAATPHFVSQVATKTCQTVNSSGYSGNGDGKPYQSCSISYSYPIAPPDNTNDPCADATYYIEASRHQFGQGIIQSKFLYLNTYYCNNFYGACQRMVSPIMNQPYIKPNNTHIACVVTYGAINAGGKEGILNIEMSVSDKSGVELRTVMQLR